MVAKQKAHLLARCWPREAGGRLNRRGVSNVIGEGGAHLTSLVGPRLKGRCKKMKQAVSSVLTCQEQTLQSQSLTFRLEAIFITLINGIQEAKGPGATMQASGKLARGPNLKHSSLYILEQLLPLATARVWNSSQETIIACSFPEGTASGHCSLLDPKQTARTNPLFLL